VSLTVGPDGPIVLNDHYLIEQMANFSRERIPERQPHAKGVELRARGLYT
jgi:catalase